jgi:hypothetical protein
MTVDTGGGTALFSNQLDLLTSYIVLGIHSLTGIGGGCLYHVSTETPQKNRPAGKIFFLPAPFSLDLRTDSSVSEADGTTPVKIRSSFVRTGVENFG